MNTFDRDDIGTKREEYVISLGQGKSERKRYSSGLKIYDTLTFPGGKPHIYHLYDNYFSLKSIPERNSEILANKSVFNTINYFIDHTEECMTEIRESEEIEESPLPEDLRLDAYGKQTVWELSISYKQQYFEALLESLSTRKSQKYEDKDIDICFSEALYLILDRINSLGDDSKRVILNGLLSYLPDGDDDLSHPSTSEVVAFLSDNDSDLKSILGDGEYEELCTQIADRQSWYSSSHHTSPSDERIV